MPVMSHVMANQRAQNLLRSLHHWPTYSSSSFFCLHTVSYIYSSLLPRTHTCPIHTSKCLVNNAVPPPPLRAALPLALPPPLLGLRPRLSSSSLTRLLPTRHSSTRLPCRPLPSRALVLVCSARWPRLLRKSSALPRLFRHSFFHMPRKPGVVLLPSRNVPLTMFSS